MLDRACTESNNVQFSILYQWGVAPEAGVD